MLAPDVVNSVIRYLAALPGSGIHATKAIVFGSQARGDTHEWSDIDLLILAPEFDVPYTFETASLLFRVKAKIDYRLEPIPCGVEEWRLPHGRPVLSFAAAEGIEVLAGDPATP